MCYMNDMLKTLKAINQTPSTNDAYMNFFCRNARALNLTLHFYEYFLVLLGNQTVWFLLQTIETRRVTRDEAGNEKETTEIRRS